jgi:cytochrome P450 family 110
MSAYEAGHSFPPRKPMQTISMRVILRAIFGLNEGPRYHQLEKYLGAMLDGLGSPLSASLLFFPILRQDLGPWGPWGKFVFNRGQIDRLIYDEIAERRGSMATTRS